MNSNILYYLISFIHDLSLNLLKDFLIFLFSHLISTLYKKNTQKLTFV